MTDPPDPHPGGASSTTIFEVEILLLDGHRCRCQLAEDSTELKTLLSMQPGGHPETTPDSLLVQIPIDRGSRSMAFSAGDVVAIETKPVTVKQPTNTDIEIEQGCVLEMNLQEGHLGGYIVATPEPSPTGLDLTNGDPATYSPGLWRWAVEVLGVRSVLDVGCGEGHSAAYFRDLGCEVVAVDGSLRAREASRIPESHVVHDFVSGPYDPGRTFDMVWSCEFVEHVEERFMANWLASFTTSHQLIMMTFAGPGQDGWHHVNCQPEQHWIDLMKGNGFTFDHDLTVEARSQSEPGHFKARGLVFVAAGTERPEGWPKSATWCSSGAPEETREWLETVTSKTKVNIASLSEVPANLVSVKPVETRMERPRTLDPDIADGPWYSQLDQAFMLELHDAFIGDNVVFDSDHYFGLGRWWLGTDDDSWKLYQHIEEVHHVDQAISITSWGGESFQLFILDTLPRLGTLFELMERADFSDLKLVSHCAEAKAARWFWNELGLQDRLVQKPMSAKDHFVVHADQVLYPQWGPNLKRYGLHPRHSLLPVQERLGVLDGTEQDLVLYFLRNTRERSVANREALIERLRQVVSGSKYELRVFNSSGDFNRDRELVKRAKIIIGPHGGALANMVFAQPGTHVIEFLPIYRLYREGADPRPGYWGLSQAAGLDYWTVEPATFEFGKSPMEIDIEKVAAIVDLLLDRSGKANAPHDRGPVISPPHPGNYEAVEAISPEDHPVKLTHRAPDGTPLAICNSEKDSDRPTGRRLRKRSSRQKVMLFGVPGYLLPKIFDWTSNDVDATVDTAVMFNEQILRQVDRPGRKIGWIRESPAIAEWMRVTAALVNDLERFTSAYEVILSSDRALCARCPGIHYHPSGANLPWPWIREGDYRIYPKTQLCSMFASPKTMVEGHLIRHEFAERLKDQLDLYGGACGSKRIGGSGSHPDKSEGLVPYMFNATMENCRTDLYYTEKITDCFVCGTVPVYWGADTIGEIFDTEGIITLDGSFSVDSLSEDLYREMLPSVHNNLEITRSLELADDQLYRMFIE